MVIASGSGGNDALPYQISPSKTLLPAGFCIYPNPPPGGITEEIPKRYRQRSPQLAWSRFPQRECPTHEAVPRVVTQAIQVEREWSPADPSPQ